MADEVDNTNARARTMEEYLDADPATQAARARLEPRYIFDDATLVCFVRHLLIAGAIAASIELEDEHLDRSRLDNDITGAMGVAWAIQAVADLTTTAEGCVVFEEEAPVDE